MQRNAAKCKEQTSVRLTGRFAISCTVVIPPAQTIIVHHTYHHHAQDTTVFGAKFDNEDNERTGTTNQYKATSAIVR